MSYPQFWKSIMTKLQDFRWDLKRNKHGKKAFRITIEHRHKRFTDNRKRATIDLQGPEMESLVEEIEGIFRRKELELLKKIEDYEAEDGARRGVDTVGSVDSKDNEE